MSDWALTALQMLDPERAHALVIRALKNGWGIGQPVYAEPSLALEVAGLKLKHPIGCAAGFDKNGEIPDVLARLGFAFVEIGTVTPLAQSGNSHPRVFRFPECGAVINRLGFNNAGADQVCENLICARKKMFLPGHNPSRVPVGVNIGANASSTDRTGDYIRAYSTLAKVADYVVINVSSPNTSGLRALQEPGKLQSLLEALEVVRRSDAEHKPLFLKVAPDLTCTQIEEIASVVLRNHSVNGLIVSNTTLNRDGLTARMRRTTGGLSGRPLFLRSTSVLARFYLHLKGNVPIIGVGGIDAPKRALEKLQAGARAVQIYTGTIYKGPGLISDCVTFLERYVANERLKSIEQTIGTRASFWAEQSW